MTHAILQIGSVLNSRNNISPPVLSAKISLSMLKRQLSYLVCVCEIARLVAWSIFNQPSYPLVADMFYKVLFINTNIYVRYVTKIVLGMSFIVLI